jgi:hypothetical protein
LETIEKLPFPPLSPVPSEKEKKGCSKLNNKSFCGSPLNREKVRRINRTGTNLLINNPPSRDFQRAFKLSRFEGGMSI